MTDLIQDVRFALRQMMRAPSFALVAIATLALSIGSAAAIFSVIDATLIRPLPYAEPERIVDLHTFSPQGYTQPASWGQYLDWKKQNSTLDALAGFDTGSSNLQAGESVSPVRVVSGTDQFFDVFDVKPLLGRTFQQGEENAGHNDIAVLSYDLWQSTFHGRKDILGTIIRIDGVPNVVVGVMPAGFRYPLSIREALYRPIHVPATELDRRGSHFLPLIGRLKRGVALPVAQADIQHVFDNLGRTYPDEAGRRLKLRTLAEATLGNTRPALQTLTFAVLGVLLIGCVNIAGLLLARGVHRQRELSLRTAVGAGRGRIARQIFTESAVVAFAGATAGLGFAFALLQAVKQLLIQSLARGAEISLNLPVLAATVVVAMICALLAGSYPALSLSRSSPSQVLRAGGAAGVSKAQHRLRGSFIVVQVALALCLLVCSGLLLRQLQALRSIDLGFSPEHLLSTELYLSGENYKGRNMLTGFYTPLLDRVRAIPGVTGAGVINLLPIMEYGSNSDVSIVGKPPAPPNQETLAENRILVPGTLEAFGARLVSGRMLNDSLDRADTPVVVVVNQALVRKFFSPGEDAVGRLINWGGTKVPIVGVTTDLRQSLTQPVLAEMDLSAAQVPAEYAADSLVRQQLVIRTSVEPAAIIPQLRQALHETDASVPFRTPETMHEVISETLTFERLEGWLFGIFAGLALTLSLVGIYGTITHEVELRTREIGIRMALGSSRQRVAREVLGRVTVLLTAGLAGGWLIAFLARRWIASLVELQPGKNAALFVTVSLLLMLCGVAASLWPARRATAIDPMQALRTE
jgi:predicted permease